LGDNPEGCRGSGGDIQRFYRRDLTLVEAERCLEQLNLTLPPPSYEALRYQQLAEKL
jgi:hypothetical protein